MLEKWWRA